MSGREFDARRVADAIQERKQSAQLTTSRCASESEWDLETYWRARAEGLSEAEAIVRKAIAESSLRGGSDG